MQTPETPAPASSTPSSLWYYGGGILSVAVGMFAISAPYIASIVLVQLIGFLCLASGVILLSSSLFGKEKKHWLSGLISSLLRGVVGILLLANVIAGLAAITLTLAALFVLEGLLEAIATYTLFKNKNKAWPWVLLNALAALVLGGILFADLPGDSSWAIGLLFGINSIFLGVSFLMVGIYQPRPTT